ncbi:hypothetical protein GUJ93_ZPchr0005g15455 [Zizania palustris]|uniref:tRNAHis guanylyltransferase catalytic domain-containing protein n=1 Tax=Zizania palustris TaxID=103762 RepID=A0A8J5SN04_ZIZPA|nr:hypothetical protein GUJ93_ZPchr0005g15455 [Zizania palustris]
MANVDIIGSEFWENHQYILREEKCRYEYVKKFDINHRLPPCNWTVVRINACQFERFSLIHSFNKPNDWTSLRLMNASASLMMGSFPDILFGYGFGHEYSFLFQEKTELYQRQESLILSSCHTNNQYNTCFWMLVNSGKNENEAHEILKGTLSKDKNNLLFMQFHLNYNNEPAIFRKGSCIYWQKVEDSEDVDREKITRERWDVVVAHADMGPEFWRMRPCI